MVLGHCATHLRVQFNTCSFSNGGHRFVCPSIARAKLPLGFSLVVGCHDCVHLHCRIRESPPLVSASAGADYCRVRWRGMCFYWLRNVFASDCNCVINVACSYVPDSCLRPCATILCILRGATSPC